MNKIVAALLAVLVAAPAWADGVIIKGNSTFDANYPEAYSGQSGSPAGFTVGGAASDPNAGLELKAKGSGVVSIPSPAMIGGTLGVAGAVNTTSPLGYQQNGATIMRVFGNSGGVFGDGAGTDTLVGLGAGASLPAADYLTTAVGWHALFSSTMTNTESTAIGWNSQGSIVDGDQNTTVGINTLGTSQHSHHVICFGTDCMRNGTASYNTGIGVDTLINDNGGSNIAIGDATYQSNLSSTGNLNIAMGFQTFQGLSLISASRNILIGAGIANNATSLNNTIAIGNLAGSSLVSQANSVLVGAQAAQNSVGNGYLTVLGALAAQASTYGQQSTIIGQGVGATTFGTGGPGTVSGVILLGSGARTVDTPASTTSNYINIENVFTVTGTGTPATSIAQIAGALTVGNELTAAKITDPATAPGAGEFKVTVVAGTTAGTCKLIARAGTSTTPVTIIDNVGSGC